MGEIDKLLHVAPGSDTTAIQELAAAPLTALATMSANDNKVLNQYGAVHVMLTNVTNPASPVRVLADSLQCLSQLVRSDGSARTHFVGMNGLEIVFECRASPHHVVRKRALQVVESLLLQSRSDRDSLDRYTDHILSGICSFLTIQPREVAESAGKLLMRLCRMASATGQMFESFRVEKSLPFRVDSRNPGERYFNGIRFLFSMLQDSTVASGVLSNVPSVAAVSALQIARSQASLGKESRASSADLWRRSTSAGNLKPKPPRGMSAGSLSARSYSYSSSSTSMAGGRSVLYHSMKYDSNDYSCVGSVGYYTLEALWAMFSSAEHSNKVADGLLREGLLEMLANIFTHRHGLLVQEEDRLLLKTWCRAIERASSAGDGVLPPALLAHAHRKLEDQSIVEPFQWLTSTQIKDLTRSCKYMKLSAGTVLGVQGGDADAALLVLSGEVRMERHVETSNRTSELGTLKAGQMYGV